MYRALPIATWHLTLVVLSGVGMRSTTCVALSLESKLARTRTVYSTRDLDTSSTIGCTLKGKLTLLVHRYLFAMEVSDIVHARPNHAAHLINSNSPSGGMKLMLRSTSYLPNLTHWWNWQSSRTMASSASADEDPLRSQSAKFSVSFVRGYIQAYLRTFFPASACRSSQIGIPAFQKDMRASRSARRRQRGAQSLSSS